MTAVLEVGQDTKTGHGPTESQLLDVLYEVLAQGAPPKGSLTVEEVQAFLHAHAREKKSIPEMLAFFRKHELPIEASAYGADPMLKELASGLHRERGPISATFSLEGDEADETERLRAEGSGQIRRIQADTDTVEVEDTSPRARMQPVPAVPQKKGRIWPWVAAAGAVTLALGAALWATHQHAQQLESSLNQARLQQRSTDGALTELERTAETLRGQLAESEHERIDLTQRFDAFSAEEAEKRAAEEAVLKRLLGQRYENMRKKVQHEAELSQAQAR